MSISFGGLGIISLRNSFVDISDIVLGKREVRSLFFALILFFVVLVLAYFTNPSENSFRTYLTEQSFRQHLSRLDYNNDEDLSDPEDARDAYLLARRQGSSRSCKNTNDPPFHFANRASISLRTPKHIFHTFGVCTVAAVVPFPSGSNGHGTDQEGSAILDYWFIGAFGKWWRVGPMDAWFHDMIVRSKEEEDWSSGILGFKAMDKFNEYNGFPFARSNSQQQLPARGSPPKLRNRERSLSQRTNGSSAHRSSTPPPLPKSASLPLHATRLPSPPDARHAQLDRIAAQPALQSSSSSSSGSPVVSRSPSSLLDQSPVIAEVLRQISMSKSTVHDLHTQLTQFQSAASQSHATLQSEVDSYRERRRQEDASRLELKSRTKTLEDSKRHAEGHKKDVEKRLKAAQNARDDCTQRIERFNSEIARLQQRSVDDEAATQQCKADTAKAEQEISETLELKKQEIKVAEDVITALNARAKELEESLANEKERLRQARERAESRKHFPVHNTHPDSSSTWPPVGFRPSETTRSEYSDGFSCRDAETDKGPQSRDISRSPRPANLSLVGISNLSSSTCDTGHPARRLKGYSIFNDSIASLQPLHTNFSPFGDTDSPSSQTHGITPVSTSLIPTGLMNVMDNSSESLARSFQSESDAYLDKDWRGISAAHTQPFDKAGGLTASPLSITSPSFKDYLEVRQLESMRRDPMAMQRATMPTPHRTHSDPNMNVPEDGYIIGDKAQQLPRRWFSTSSKEKPQKKGLNPGAKVFRLNKTPPDLRTIGPHQALPPAPASPVYDALNPNGLGSRMIATPSADTSSLLRAFAPSPAEREVLQRALGGSTNASLERLPSLSNVGSIPPSPPHVHAIANHHAHPSALHIEGGEPRHNWQSWLQSLPRIGKSNFSPWDDDEPSEKPSFGGYGTSSRSGLRE